jgi:hypothetical protein
MADAAQITRELESFYRRYIEIFNREETEQLIDCFTHPYAVISNSRGMVPVAGVDEHRKSFIRAMTALKGRGWARSHIDSIKAWPLSEHLGMIVSDVRRYKTDGGVLEIVRACYTLCRDGGSWKIATLVEIRPPFRGPGDVPYPTGR